MTDPTPSVEQDRAIQACRRWFKDGLSFGFYLAGPAGAGKTSIAKRLAQDARNPQFAAYTGRAALQLTKKGCPAKTLHQLLYQPVTDEDGRVAFYPREWNEEHPLFHCNLLIIDEAPMAPIEMADLILKTGKPYLLIGDPYQLPPPTGGGALIAGQKPDFLLTEIHRQALDNPVLQLATRIREGKGLLPQFMLKSRSPVEDAVAVLDTMANRYESGSSRMLLAGKRETVRALNMRCRSAKGSLLEPGEPVLCLRNNHAIGMMNGSIWTSQSHLQEDRVEFDEQTKNIYPTKLDLASTDFQGLILKDVSINVMAMLGMPEDSGWRGKGTPCDYGYGRTVHKAQGDEALFGVIVDEAWVFRDARIKWLYTAVTRFMEEVKIISPK